MTGGGGWTFAFPQNFAGVFEVDVPTSPAAAGAVVTLYAGELLYANNNTANLQINWTSSLLFPASLDTVQMSTDLQSWTTGTGQLTAVPTAGFPVALFQSPLSSVSPRFYRLRAAYSAD